jgi:hypothetical protein
MPNRNEVQITVTLTTAQAEAYDMVDAGEVLRTALAEAGYSPR